MTTISQLPAAITGSAGDLLPLVQSDGATHAANPGALAVLPTGATTARTLAARAGDVVNVLDFGAVADGVTDCHAAIMAAHNALPNGGAIELPRGTLYCAQSLVFTNSGIWLRGQGDAATILTFPNAPIAGLQQGNSTTTVRGNRVSDITVESEATSASAPVDGSIGIYWANFNYGLEDDVRVRLFDVGRVWDYLPGGSFLSVAYHASRIFADSCVTAYDKQAAAAGIFINNLEYGANGSDLYNPAYGTIFTGKANDHKKVSGEIIPRAPGTPATIGIYFEAFTQGSDTIIEYGALHFENVASLAGSDVNTPLITSLSFNGTTASVLTANGFVFNSATVLKNCNIHGGNFGGGVYSITSPEQVSIVGNFFAQLNLTGSSTSHTATVCGNTVGSGVISGTFGGLHLLGNPAVGGSWSGSVTCSDLLIMACTGLTNTLGNYTTLGNESIQYLEIYNPASGGTVTIPLSQRDVRIEGSALSTLTVNFSGVPTANQRWYVKFYSAVTTLTITPPSGWSIIGAPSSVSAGQSFEVLAQPGASTIYW